MAKVGVIVLADIETHADMGRVANAVETVIARRYGKVITAPQGRAAQMNAGAAAASSD